MEDIALKTLWQAANAKLDSQLAINRQLSEDVTKLKVESALSGMKPMKKFLIALGIIWVVLLDIILMASWKEANVFFLVSALSQSIITKFAIGIYLYQMVLIQQLDNTVTVIEVQTKLAKLRSSTLLATRILFLQLPFWTTFHLNKGMLEEGHPLLWAFQATITALFSILSIWLFVSIKYENRHKRWFKWLFSGKEWQPIIHSMELLEQLESFK